MDTRASLRDLIKKLGGGGVVKNVSASVTTYV